MALITRLLKPWYTVWEPEASAHRVDDCPRIPYNGLLPFPTENALTFIHDFWAFQSLIVCLKIFFFHFHARIVLLFIVKQIENIISSILMHNLQQCDSTKCLSDQKDYNYYLLIFIYSLYISPKRKKKIHKNCLNIIWKFYPELISAGE